MPVHRYKRTGEPNGKSICVYLRGRGRRARLLRKYCHKVYELGYVPICPKLSLLQYLSIDVPEEQRAIGRSASRFLRRCRMLVVCGNEISTAMAGEIGTAEKLKLICTTLDGPSSNQGSREPIYMLNGCGAGSTRGLERLA